MELEATQPVENNYSTTSSRYPGHLELDDESLADIFCIIHPASYHAYLAVAHITGDNPEYTLDTDEAGTQDDTEDKESIDDTEEDKENVPVVAKDDEVQDTQEIPLGTDVSIEHSKDIVLRLSRVPKHPLLGFTFGRHPKLSDIELREIGDKHWLSNRAFRIYVNENGAIMLEDASTNGTAVDGELLRIGQKENGGKYRWTLGQGSVIKCVHPLHDYKFVVTIPRREGQVEEMFEQNLNAYFDQINAIKLDKNPNTNPSPPVLFPHAASDTSYTTSITTVAKRRQWNGGNAYNFNKKIGQGAFATVYLITRRDNGDAFAAKEIQKHRIAKGGISQLKNEIKIMARIHHDNIVNFVEYREEGDYLYIIMEYIPGNDLGHTLQQLQRPLAEEQVQEMASQLLSALGYLHSIDIVHRDIKPDNIMLSSLEPIQAKLTDFGLSKLISGNDKDMRTFCGTILYCAPEVYREYIEYDPHTGQHRPDRASRKILREPYTNACDLWSLGGVLFYSLCRMPPYPVSNDRDFIYQEILHTIMTKTLDLRPLQNYDLSEQCIGFIRSMLKRYPGQRPSIEKLQAHPWMTGLPSTQQTTQTTNEEEDGDDISDLDATEYVPVDDGSGTSRSVLDSRDGNESIGSLDEIDRDNLGLSRVRSFDNTLSSLNSSESSFSESFAFMRNGPDRERLFGELGSSALGSSGVIPDGRLNLPLPHVGNERQYDPNTSTHDPSDSYIHPLLRLGNRALRLEDLGDQDSPSLLGTESVFGHLHVKSASLPSDMTDSPEAQSPEGDSPDSTGAINPPQSFVTAPSTSVRRQREDSDEGASMSAPKRSKPGNKPDDYVLYHNYWWDPRDQRTWHDDYPVMTLGELKKLEAEAEAQGKKYKPTRTTDTPKYANPADYDVSGFRTLGTSTKGKDDSSFQVPPRIIATLTAIEETALPGIKIKVTEQFTSWGRGFANTHVYYNGKETRISKYALKLVIYNPANAHGDALKDPGSSFYISTKALEGLRVNGLPVFSFERETPRSESRYWVKLRTGDLVQLYMKGELRHSIVLKFKCLFGASVKERSPNEPVIIVPEGSKERADLEAITARCETEVWKRAHIDNTEQFYAVNLSQRASTEPPSATTGQLSGHTKNPNHSMPGNNGRPNGRARGPLERVRRQSGVSSNLPPTLDGRGSNSAGSRSPANSEDHRSLANRRKSFVVSTMPNINGNPSASSTSSVNRPPGSSAHGTTLTQKMSDTHLQQSSNRQSSAVANARVASQVFNSRSRQVTREATPAPKGQSFAASEASTERL